MNPSFLIFLYPFLVIFMHISQLQLLAIYPETGNVSVKCIERERQALLALKQGFLLSKDWLSSWGNGENQKECCNWKGIQCSNETGHVLKLDLQGDGMDQIAGSISPSLAGLHYLKHLDLSHNSFQGKIPPQLGNLKSLKYLSLGNNELNGTIPLQLGNLKFLRYLSLDYNKLDGTIPYQLGNLKSLKYLSLYSNELNGTIPPQLGNILPLKYLDLRGNEFTGTIPRHLGNLSNLQHLFLDSILGSLRSDLQWVSHLSSLTHLTLRGVDLSSATNWLWLLSGLSHLQELDIGWCNLLDSILPFLSSASNYSTLLSSVDISFNNLTSLSLLFPLFMNSSTSLATLYLNGNNLRSTIPEVFGNLISLQSLDLSSNLLQGPVPDLSQLSSLQLLRLNDNRLDGTLNEGIGKLSNLKDLSLRKNSLHGLVSEAHFSRLFNLSFLDLSNNGLVFNISADWVPPFNLSHINLASCILGPSFPRWLQTQNQLLELDISGAGISDTVPNWFWQLTSTLLRLNLSHNHIKGEIENLPSVYPTFAVMDLSSNLFEGSIPAFLSMTSWLDLSNNKFSMAKLLLCANTTKILAYLDLSNNNLWGELPDCWKNFQLLVFLDLTNNYLHGNLPKSMGSLRNIQSLHLGSNNFSGEIPLSLSNCQDLQVFDVAQNKFSGSLPSWIGYGFPKLLVLSMRSNKFRGSMPLGICHLIKLQLLDFSSNNISGNLPKCFNNLSAMASQADLDATITFYFDEQYRSILSHYLSHDRATFVTTIAMSKHKTLSGRFSSDSFYDSATLMWKGKISKYRSTLGLLRSIDLSSNNLTGEIPSEIMELVGLVSLNISRNVLSGEIPPNIGQLKSLDFLDLSRNHLSGRIPSQLSQLDRISVLDLSYNNLSGEIPLGTQLQGRDASAYFGNPKLCGAPLNNSCPSKQKHDHQSDRNDGHGGEFFSMGFYIAMAMGFIVGFWGVCCTLVLKDSWRYAYFKFWDDAYDKLYVLIAIRMAKLRRRIET